MSAPPRTIEALEGRLPDPEPPVRGEALLRALDRAWIAVEQAVNRVLPERLNPLLEAGAIANVSLALAVLSGILVLIWYTPNVHDAWSSVEAMTASPWTAGLMRSIHRYSSDAAVLFAVVHGFRLFIARRFTGARWLAWVTGLGAVAALWLTGWLGYWLVWDTRAQQVAVGTARVLDALPIFADPLSRSFLTDARLNSLLFFVIFFIHMLLPMAMAVLLWLHIARLNRPRFLTIRPMTLAVVATTVLVSALAPATSSELAHVGMVPEQFTRDIWYLLPLGLTDRLGSGALWAVGLVGTLALVSVPWSLRRSQIRVARVTESRCQGCRICSTDCPYDAIAMVPRAEQLNPLAHIAAGPAEITPAADANRKHDHSIVARIDPAACVGCGICAGSCDSAAIGLEWFSALDQRKRVDQALGSKREEAPRVAFVCAGSGAAAVGSLPGYEIETVPCVGWLHPLSIERAVRHGAPDVVIAACGTCRYREGAAWADARLHGTREPAIRPEKVRADQVHVVVADDPATLRRIAAGVISGARASSTRAARPVLRAAAGLLAAGLSAAVVWAGSDLPYAVPGDSRPQIVVSFLLAAQSAERCRPPTDAEKAARPIHMQAAQICERGRPPVRLQVTVDGEIAHEKAWPPGGLWNDGASVAIARMPVEPGAHRIDIKIDDGGEGAWTHEAGRSVTVQERQRYVVLFDKNDGFTWPGEDTP